MEEIEKAADHLPKYCLSLYVKYYSVSTATKYQSTRTKENSFYC